jgi:hypothetical protein
VTRGLTSCRGPSTTMSAAAEVPEEFRVYPLAFTSPCEQVAVWTIAKGETDIKLRIEVLKREEGAVLRTLAPLRL